MEMRRVRWPARAAKTAIAAAQVVLPTPPLPPMNRCLVGIRAGVEPPVQN